MQTINVQGNFITIDTEKIIETVEILNTLNEKLKEAKTLINDLAKNEIFLNLVVKNTNEKQVD